MQNELCDGLSNISVQSVRKGYLREWTAEKQSLYSKKNMVYETH
jgi:hypothetical protein